MNNSSLLTADRNTHLKIVVIALACATLIACIGIASRVTDTYATAEGQFESGVIKAGKPVTASTADNRTIR